MARRRTRGQSKESKQKQVEALEKKRAARSDVQQIQLLRNRPGESKKEIDRLSNKK